MCLQLWTFTGWMSLYYQDRFTVNERILVQMIASEEKNSLSHMIRKLGVQLYIGMSGSCRVNKRDQDGPSFQVSFLWVTFIFRHAFSVWFLSNMSLHHPKIKLKRKMVPFPHDSRNVPEKLPLVGWSHLSVPGPVLVAQETDVPFS